MDVHHDAQLRRSCDHVYLLFISLPRSGYAKKNLSMETVSNDASIGTKKSHQMYKLKAPHFSRKSLFLSGSIWPRI